MKRLVLVLAFVSSPLAAWAACSDEEQQVMSCAEGLTWDPETDTCLPIVSG